ncbi:strong similarity to phosphohydrolase [Virus Rctr197k]|nr:strong similarity to phosphohydrolase [Virus Rctr197k]
MKSTIIFHANCHDGVTALWAATRRLPDADMYAGKYDEPPDLERLRGCDVVFVDFCWRRAAMVAVREVASSVLVLDHHKTAMDAMVGQGENFVDMRSWSGPITWERHLENITQDADEGVHNSIYMLFDMERSGAGIAWDVLMSGNPRPLLIDYVEDRDLWRFKLIGSREVHAACSSFPLSLVARTMLMAMPIQKLIDDGSVILRYHNKLVETAAGHAIMAELGGHTVPTLACPNIELAPDIGHKLAQGHPFAAIYVDRSDGSRYYQLRSSSEGLDVGEIAQRLGGGGHRNAAGYTRKP